MERDRRRGCLRMARFGHPAMSAVRSLSGANRTSQMQANVVIDPSATLPAFHVAVAREWWKGAGGLGSFLKNRAAIGGPVKCRMGPD